MKTVFNNRLNKIEKTLDKIQQLKNPEIKRMPRVEILIRMEPYDLSLQEKCKVDDYAKENDLTWDESLQEFYPEKYTTAKEIACKRAFREQYNYPPKAESLQKSIEQWQDKNEAYCKFKDQYFSKGERSGT
jgi:hypothetical protein